MIEINGAFGEGGGQILRTTLTLSLLNQVPVKIKNIRAKRSKPGLMRQHLACVKAAQTISQATVSGAELHSTELIFKPQPVKGGTYCFDIGSAGSTTLVFQTIMLPLMLAQKSSHITFKGGTHNPLAPPLTDIKHGFLPLIKKMGGKVDIETQQWGYAPFGGGEWIAKIHPSTLNPLTLTKKGVLIQSRIRSYISCVKHSIAQREIDTYRERSKVNIDVSESRNPPALSAGNLLTHRLKYEHYETCFSQLGQKRMPAEKIAERLAHDVNQHLESGSTLSPFLADQILLPILVAGKGEYTTSEITQHTETNINTIFEITGKKFDYWPESNLFKIKMG